MTRASKSGGEEGARRPETVPVSLVCTPPQSARCATRMTSMVGWSLGYLSVAVGGETNLKLWNPCNPSPPPPSASVTDRGEKCKALHDRSLQRGCARFATTTAVRNGRTVEQPSADGRMEYDLLLYSSCPSVASCPLSEWRNERTHEGDGGTATYFCITFRGTAAPSHSIYPT